MKTPSGLCSWSVAPFTIFSFPYAPWFFYFSSEFFSDGLPITGCTLGVFTFARN
jgi:hypothetical protein